MRRAVVALALAACTPHVDGAGESGGRGMTPRGGGMAGTAVGGAGGSATMPEPAATLTCESPGTGDLPGPRLLRRLTGREVDATVRAVFGFDAATWQGNTLPPDPASIDGFTNNVDRLTVGEDYARGALETAQKVAGLVTSDAHLARLLPCAAQGDEACAGMFLDRYATRLYRRPLTVAERGRYLALHKTVRAKSDFKSWAYWATTAMLQSPNVLYRSELGEPAAGGRWKLTPYEVATALAFTFTGAPPSTELLALAGSNKLETPDQLEAAARALAYEAPGKVRPAFRELLLSFADQWLGLSPLANLKKDEQAFAQFTPAVQEAMAEETRRFLSSVIVDDQGKPADLLTAPYTFVDATLAQVLRLSGPCFRLRQGDPQGWLGPGPPGPGLAAGHRGPQPEDLAHQARLPGAHPPDVRHRPPAPRHGRSPPRAHRGPDHPPALRGPARQERQLPRLPRDHRSDRLRTGEAGRRRPPPRQGGRLRHRRQRPHLQHQRRHPRLPRPRRAGPTLARLPELTDCMAAFMAGNAFGLDHRNTPCLIRNEMAELRAGKLSIVEYYVKLARSEHFRFRVQ